jgi:hypothetical protein
LGKIGKATTGLRQVYRQQLLKLESKHYNDDSDLSKMDLTQVATKNPLLCFRW